MFPKVPNFTEIFLEANIMDSFYNISLGKILFLSRLFNYPFLLELF